MEQYLAQLHQALMAGQEKTAEDVEFEIFSKMAADQGIDLNAIAQQYGNEAVAELYRDTMQKFAESAAAEAKKEGEPEEQEEEEKAKEKKAAAQAYWLEQQQEKQAAEAKMAEADVMGRVMAHAFDDELKKMAEGSPSTERIPALREVAGKLDVKPTHPPAGKPSAKELADAANLTDLSHKARSPRVSALLEKIKGNRVAQHIAGHKLPYALGAGALTAAGAAALGHHLGKKKEAAASFDLAAAEQGLKMASAAGYDANQAIERLNAVLTLGVPESEKVAAMQTVDDALNQRAFELLECAGYKVNW